MRGGRGRREQEWDLRDEAVSDRIAEGHHYNGYESGEGVANERPVYACDLTHHHAADLDMVSVVYVT